MQTCAPSRCDSPLVCRVCPGPAETGVAAGHRPVGWPRSRDHHLRGALHWGAAGGPAGLAHGAEPVARRSAASFAPVRGSHRRRRAGRLVARLHERVGNLRRDHAFKLANDLVRRFDVIYVETLNLQGLARSRLAREVHDQGWGAFLTILSDKAAEAGRSVIALDPRNTSQACSACGTLVPKPLQERWHRCACGYQADRDVNAACNLYRLGETRQAPTWPTGACVA